jgi:hypothetical protein
MFRRTHTLSATTSAISWSVYEADDFSVKILTLNFDSAPTTSENITLSIDSANGSSYDTVIRIIDPSITSSVDITFEDLNLFSSGDKLLVSYTNTDGNSITGTAVVEI